MVDLVLVTGASGGIGAVTALEVAKTGVTVVVHYHSNHQAAQSVAQQITEHGGAALIKQADLANEQEVEALFAELDQLGTLTGLVNNAGVTSLIDEFTRYTAARIEHVLKTNVLSVFLCSREAVKRMSTMRGGKGGVIVNVSSAASRIGSPHEYIDYAASKGAVDTFTLGLAKEVAEQGIRVNAVRPGLIETTIHASSGLPNRCELLSPQVPMKRAGKAQEVAATILWLLSNQASYVTGALLDVSGGR